MIVLLRRLRSPPGISCASTTSQFFVEGNVSNTTTVMMESKKSARRIRAAGLVRMRGEISARMTNPRGRTIGNLLMDVLGDDTLPAYVGIDIVYG